VYITNCVVFLLSQAFTPLTPPVVIPGSSYFVVLGKLGDRYHVQIRRGKTVVSLVPIYSLDVSEISAIVYSEIKIPMFNMLSVMKAVGRLLNYLESGTPYTPPPTEQPATSVTEPVREQIPPPTPPEKEEHRPIEMVEEKVELPKESITVQSIEFAKEEAKKEISNLTLEEKWKRAVANLDLIMGLLTTLLREKYGDTAVRNFWDQYAEYLAKLWKASAAASFESKIVNLVHWAEVMGINIVTVEFNSQHFVGEVPKCLLNERTTTIKQLGLDLPNDFPCNMCWMIFSKVSDALGITYKLDKKDKRCIFKFEKPTSGIRL